MNDISKANLGEDWRFGKVSYIKSNPVPPVSVLSPYFAVAHLIVCPDTMRWVLLSAIQHPS